MAGSAPQGRGLFVTIFKNFYNSFKVLAPKARTGVLIGEDHEGNKYFEIPADPSRGKRRPQRWYTAPTTGQKDIVGRDLYAGFDATLPAEWESWLRHRRDDPPTPQQVAASLAEAEMKKFNAAKLEGKRIEELTQAGRSTEPPGLQDHEKPVFPKYDEYEIAPGENEFQNKDKWASYKNPYSKKQ